jgi:hypothetical protein
LAQLAGHKGEVTLSRLVRDLTGKLDIYELNSDQPLFMLSGQLVSSEDDIPLESVADFESFKSEFLKINSEIGFLVSLHSENFTQNILVIEDLSILDSLCET